MPAAMTPTEPRRSESTCKECSADAQVGARRTRQQPCRDEVHRQADGRDGQNARA
jgi:hypothetical protein